MVYTIFGTPYRILRDEDTYVDMNIIKSTLFL